MKEEYFVMVGFADMPCEPLEKSKVDEKLAGIEKIIGSPPYMEKDLYAVSRAEGFETGHLPLRPTSCIDTATGKEHPAFFFPISGYLQSKRLDFYKDRMKIIYTIREDIKGFGKVVTTYAVSATDVPPDYSIVKKLSR